MPLLEQLTCEKDYLTLYENKDKRIIWDNNQFLYVASAYFNDHRLKEAIQSIIFELDIHSMQYSYFCFGYLAFKSDKTEK